MRTYADTRRCFNQGGQDWHDLKGSGWVGISPLGARNVALAFTEDSENLFYSSPLLDNPEVMQRDPVGMTGGPGGDRLRFAPEYAYSWKSDDHDVDRFSNYVVQEDPGDWKVELRTGSVILRMEATFWDMRDGRSLRFQVTRKVLPTRTPLTGHSQSVRFAGYELQHELHVLAAGAHQRIGMWNLLQEPAGSVLIVPTKGVPQPVSYFKPGSWTNKRDHLAWRYSGTANAKIGLEVEQITGRTGVLRRLSQGELLLVVRQFPVHRDLYYCDARTEAESGKQIFHAFDGFGFGEMEFHSPAVGAPPLPRDYSEKSSLWAFAGDDLPVIDVARELLGVDVSTDVPGAC